MASQQAVPIETILAAIYQLGATLSAAANTPSPSISSSTSSILLSTPSILPSTPSIPTGRSSISTSAPSVPGIQAPPQLNTRFAALSGTTSQARNAYTGRLPLVVKPPVDEDIVFNVTYYLKVVDYDIHPIKGNIPYSLNHIPISLVHMLITGV